MIVVTLVLIIIILLLVIGSVGGTYWYFYVRCGGDKIAGNTCSKDCQCAAPGICGLENAASGAKSVCCAAGSLTVGSQKYCTNLSIGSACLNNAFCASNNCSGGVCIAAVPPSGPGGSTPGKQYGSGSLPKGAPCKLSSDCSGTLICADSGFFAQPAPWCCNGSQKSNDPSQNLCLDWVTGTVCNPAMAFQCTSQKCTNGRCE